MMHSQEPSYYEIALTNRQVLGFFVVLLLCVVGAFFSGIWLGKKQPGGPQQVAQVEAAAADGEATKPLEELNFFTDPQPSTAAQKAPERAAASKPKPRQPAASGGAATTLAEDLAAPAQLDEPATEAPSRTEAPPAPAQAMTGFVLQVFSSPDQARAEQFVTQLRGDGYAAFLVREVIDGRTTHRVRIGPFADRAEADRLKPLVAKAYKVEPWVAPIE